MQVLRGKIVPGFGVGGEIIQDYLQIFKREIKMDIFPGTLNLELDKEWEMPENCGFIEGFVK
ncbi:MAG TPA: hypothetical protein VJB06_04705 [archaeon]|nr:hypothetical protein [archaeon]